MAYYLVHFVNKSFALVEADNGNLVVDLLRFFVAGRPSLTACFGREQVVGYQEIDKDDFEALHPVWTQKQLQAETHVHVADDTHDECRCTPATV